MRYHYVYKITDKKRNKYYIGCRSSKIKPEQDLGHIYFSSSCNKEFIAEQKKIPSRFLYKVIKTFSSREKALDYETQLIDKYHAINDKNSYNGRNVLEFATVDSRATKSTVAYLGKLIKLARKERGITQTELGERINGSRSVIQRIELGNTKVSIGSVFEACFLLGIPLMGCDKEHINNLSKMLSYINILIPSSSQNNNKVVDDDF